MFIMYILLLSTSWYNTCNIYKHIYRDDFHNGNCK